MKKSPSVIEAQDEDDDDWGGLSASKKKVAAEPPAAAKKGGSSANLAVAAKKPEPASAAAKKVPAPIPIEDDDDYDWGLGEDVGKIGKDAKKGGKGDDDAGIAGVRKNAEERKKLQAASDKGPDHDRSGLFEAASKGDLKMVKSILNEGKVYVDYRKRKEPKGWSALHFAVQAGQEAVVEFLLQKGADVDLMDGREKPVLHKAVGEHCKVSILKKLLDAKPNLFATSDTGNNILHECRSAEAARLILKSLDKARQKELLTMQGQDGFSPLHSVATDRGFGGRAVCEVYVELFPDTLELEDMREETPLFAAARSEAFPALAALLEAGANLGKRNAKGQSVFQVALHARKDFSAEVLISGATVNEELLQELTEMQLDMQLESELGRGSDDESDEEEQIRVALVKHHLDMFKSAFKTYNVGRQIVSTLRLGQEYLISPDFYNQAVICMNGARALCTKNLGFSGLGMKLMLEAVTTEEVNSLKRARYTKNEKNFTRHNPTTASDYSTHQKCHFMFCGKLALTDPSDDIANVLRESIESAEETGFPSIVLEKMGELYEDDW
jgi:ankyrin repeat protein